MSVNDHSDISKLAGEVEQRLQQHREALISGASRVEKKSLLRRMIQKHRDRRYYRQLGSVRRADLYAALHRLSR